MGSGPDCGWVVGCPSAALPALPPTWHPVIQRQLFGWIQFAAVQLGALEVQPDPELVLFACDDCLLTGPVVAGLPVGDQGFEPLLPSCLVSLSPGGVCLSERTANPSG